MDTSMDPLIQQTHGTILGEVLGVTHDGRPLVRTQDLPEPHAAAFAGFGPPPDWSRCAGARVVLTHLDGDPRQPVVLGVVGGLPATATHPRTLRIAAGEELTIECGKSKIHLRADGRIEIRGEHLVSRSRGPNKVKGGSVHLN